MIINHTTSVRELVDAWENIALDLDAIKSEVYYRLEDEKYRNEDERQTLEELDEILDNVIDWRFMCKLDSTSDN